MYTVDTQTSTHTHTHKHTHKIGWNKEREKKVEQKKCEVCGVLLHEEIDMHHQTIGYHFIYMCIPYIYILDLPLSSSGNNITCYKWAKEIW